MCVGIFLIHSWIRTVSGRSDKDGLRIVHSSGYSVFVNGVLRLVLSFEWLLQKGNPISPLLFTIVVDTLRRLIYRAEEVGLLDVGLCRNQLDRQTNRTDQDRHTLIGPFVFHDRGYFCQSFFSPQSSLKIRGTESSVQSLVCEK